MYLARVAIVVRDYDEAIEFYTHTLGYILLEDTDLGNGKRWVRVGSKSGVGAEFLLARAANPEQASFVGNQSGGRVFLFLETDDFDRDYAAMRSKGVRFTTEPRVESYGKVAVFEDLYGNRFDLIEPRRM